MRHFAMTGIETAAWMPLIIAGSLMRETPPAARMSAGMRSSAITAHAPAASAIFACSGVVTSMITPPLSICARLRFSSCLSGCSSFIAEISSLVSVANIIWYTLRQRVIGISPCYLIGKTYIAHRPDLMR